MLTEHTTTWVFCDSEYFWCMFPRMPLPVLLTVTPHALYWNIKESVFGHAFPCILDMVHVVSRHLMLFLYCLCLIMAAHVSSVQWRTDDQYFWKAVQLVIMRTSGKLAVLLQMLLHSRYAHTWFKTECPFYLSIQLLLFIILPQELGISASAELEQSTF